MHMNLDNLEVKIFNNSKNKPWPSQRDIISTVWEAMKPVITEMIERDYISKKEHAKILKKTIKEIMK